MKISLRTKAAAFVAAVVAGVFGALGYWRHERLAVDFAEVQSAQQAAFAGAAAADLADKLELHLNVLEQSAHLIAAGALDDPAQRRTALAPLATVRALFDGLGLVALDGEVLESEPPIAGTARVNLRDREYFARVLASRRAVVSEPVDSRMGLGPMVLMAAPVRTAEGRVVAVLAAGLRLQRANLLGRLAQASVGRTGHFEVVTGGAAPVYIVHPDAKRLLAPASPAESASDSRRIVTRVPVRGVRWELRAIVPGDEAFAPVARARERLWAILGALALFSCGVAWFGMHWLLRPLVRLREAMRSLRHAAPGSALRLDIDADDERADLAREFESLMRELRARQAELAAVTEASPLGFFRSNAAGHLTYVNDAYLRKHGLAREQAVDGWLQLLREDLRAQAWQAWQEVVRQPAPFAIVRDVVRPDGVRRRLSVRTAPLVVDGQVEGHVGTVSDVTERAAAEKALRHLTAIFDRLPDSVAQTDPQGRLLFLNPAARRRAGIPLDAPIGHLTLADLNPPDTVERHRLEIVPTALACGMWAGETLAWNAERREVPVSHIVIAHRDPQGRIEYFSALMRDISAEKAAQQALRASERRLRTIADHLPVLISYLDRDLRFRFVNETYRDWFGVDPQAQLGVSLRQFYGEPAWGEIEPYLKRALGGEEVSYERTVEHAGARREVRVTVVPDCPEPGRVEGLYTLIADISSYRCDQRRLQRQAAVLRSVTEAIPAIVAVVGADRRYRFVNSAFERWCGAPRASIVGRTLVEVLGRRDAERSEPWIARVLAGESVTFERHYADRRDASHLALSYIPLWLDDGSVDGFVGVGQDITHHREQEDRLLELAHRDVLTGLLNRAGFETFLERSLERGEGAELALLYIDLDHFKPVNDQYGHPVGDQVLQQFAARVRNAVRPSDAVARLGGDEFAVVLTGVRETSGAQRVADAVVALAQTPFDVGDLRLAVGASVGIAHGIKPGSGWRDFVAQADTMLYRAKRGGRGRHAGGALH